MKIIDYAPVIIPTLNRYDHFRRCLESLECCTGAEYTDVYVALDFPPEEKYEEGWRKIDAYLRNKENHNGFKKLHVRRRERNYGIGHKESNGEVMLKEIKKKYESYIFSEDDNEFSPCFLVYINACLQRFKDDERIVRICGYNYPMVMPDMYKNNYYISKRFSAWGSGAWTKKNKYIEENYFNFDALRDIILDDAKYHKLKNLYPRGINLIHSMLKLREFHGDSIYEVYAILEDKYFLLPSVSKVRNYGNDGTGVHCLRMGKQANELYSRQPIDQSTVFDFTDDVFTYEPIELKNYNYVAKPSFRSIYKSFVIKLDFWLLRHFGFMPKSKYI